MAVPDSIKRDSLLQLVPEALQKEVESRSELETYEEALRFVEKRIGQGWCVAAAQKMFSHSKAGPAPMELGALGTGQAQGALTCLSENRHFLKVCVCSFLISFGSKKSN